ncbi:Ff.00g061630.m01.CDS01 [Fusarium sp. VM40]|nr:Ff.00g061630.m01.CDS01 [Fusarium sp. VM40]
MDERFVKELDQLLGLVALTVDPQKVPMKNLLGEVRRMVEEMQLAYDGDCAKWQKDANRQLDEKFAKLDSLNELANRTQEAIADFQQALDDLASNELLKRKLTGIRNLLQSYAEEGGKMFRTVTQDVRALQNSVDGIKRDMPNIATNDTVSRYFDEARRRNESLTKHVEGIKDRMSNVAQREVLNEVSANAKQHQDMSKESFAKLQDSLSHTAQQETLVTICDKVDRAAIMTQRILARVDAHGTELPNLGRTMSRVEKNTGAGIGHITQKHGELSETCESTNRGVGNLVQKVDNAAGSINSRIDSVAKELIQETQKYAQELLNLQKELDASKLEKTEIEKREANGNTRYDEEQKRLEEQVRVLEEKLEAANNENMLEACNFDMKHEEWDECKRHLNEEIKKRDTEIENLLAEVEILKDDKAVLQRETIDGTFTREALDKEAEKLEQDIDDLKSELNSSKLLRQEQELRIGELDAVVAKLHGQRGQEELCATLMQSIDKAYHSSAEDFNIEMYKQRGESFEAVNRDAKRKEGDAIRDLETLNESLKAAQESLDNEKRAVAKKEEDLVHSRNALSELQGALDRANDQIISQELELCQIKSESDLMRETVDEREERLSAREKNLEEREKSLAQREPPPDGPRKRRRESSPEPIGSRTLFARGMDSLASRANYFHVVNDAHFDLQMMTTFASYLGSEKYFQRFRSFLHNGTLDKWFCFEEVSHRGSKSNIEVTTSNGGCKAHSNMQCMLVMVIMDKETRYLQFRYN